MIRLASQHTKSFAHRRKGIVAVAFSADETVLINRINDDVASPDEMFDPRTVRGRIHAEVTVKKNDNWRRRWRGIRRFVKMKGPHSLAERS